MQFYSSRNHDAKVTLEEAVMKGLAPDKGLFMPESISAMPPDFFQKLPSMSLPEIGFEVSKNLLGDSIPSADLKRIVNEAIVFDAPLVEVSSGIFSLELFHGPTLAFKDFGARFMSQLLGHFAHKQGSKITILVATSGDTGSAVANGFYQVDGIDVVVLYPKGRVSDIQEKQFTTLGKNITVLEVEGSFDDCQRLVKQAFSDAELRDRRPLSSANSINIARLIPQSFYYFRAFAQLPEPSLPLVFSVPSGNFGNLTAGLLAKRMGLPVKQFLAATNVNDVVPVYLETEVFTPRASLQSISNAMDVGDPSNFERILDLYNGNHEKVVEDITGFSFTDEETREAMRKVFETYKYVMDPHGAVAYLGVKAYQKKFNSKFNSIFLETAHPAKFKEVVDATLGEDINIPERLQQFLSGTKQTVSMGTDYADFRAILLKGY